MLTTLITIAALSTVILATNNYMLRAIHRDAVNEPKSRNKLAD